MSAAVELAVQTEMALPAQTKRTAVLRKARRPSSNATTSSTRLSSRTSSPAISTTATGAGPSYSASTASASSCTTDSSIMFAQDVTYESDDGTDDFFARRLVRDLARAEQSSRQGSPIPPAPAHSEPIQTAWVSSPELMNGWELQREDYFTPPTSPAAVACTWDPHGPVRVSPANLPASTRPSGSFASASPAPTTSTTHPAATPEPAPARRKTTKLRKGRASIPNESSPALSACPPASSKAFRFLRRFSTSAKQRAEPPDPTPVQVPRHNSAPPPEAHQQAPLSAVEFHNALYTRPSPYVLPPVVSPTTPVEVTGQGSFYSSRYVTSDPGHGGSWWDDSSFGHGPETTPATSEDIHQLAFPFLQPSQKQVASRPQPPVPQLPAALMHLRREPVLQLSPRRKPAPAVGDDADAGCAIGRAFLDTDVERVPAEERPDTMPELVSDDSWRSSEPMMPIPEPKVTLRPQLHRRPPLLRRESSRRWSLGIGSDTRLRAALCAQEIVQTEINYREVLGKLLRGETMTPPPPELLDLVPALLSASPRFASPPQAGALAKVFIESVHALERALVDWCAVAGPFFTPLGSGARSRSTSALSSLGSPTRRPTSLLVSPVLSRGRRLSITAAWDQLWDPAVTVSELDSADRTVGSGLRRRTLVSERSRRASRAHLFERLGLDLARSSPSIAVTSVSTPAGSASSADPGPGPNKNPKRPTVADLAIQPTQRAVRYVLLFRELLEHTMKLAAAEGGGDGGAGGDVPRVREALDEALRLARACDGALPQRLG